MTSATGFTPLPHYRYPPCLPHALLFHTCTTPVPTGLPTTFTFPVPGTPACIDLPVLGLFIVAYTCLCWISTGLQAQLPGNSSLPYHLYSLPSTNTHTRAEEHSFSPPKICSVPRALLILLQVKEPHTHSLLPLVFGTESRFSHWLQTFGGALHTPTNAARHQAGEQVAR